MQDLVSGLTVGGVYTLLALGFTLALGLGDIVNLAHGAFIVGGMYAVYEIVAHYGVNQYLAVLIAVAIVAAGSLVVYKTIMERARRGGHRDQIVYSLLLLSALQVAYQLEFGGDLVALPGGNASFTIFGASVARSRLIAFLVSLAVTAALAFVASHTTLGRLVRATAWYESGARSIGVRTEWIFAGVFVASGALAGLAGGLMMTFLPVSPTLGLDFLLITLIVSIAGRLTFVGCTMIGLLYGLAQTFLTDRFGDTVSTLTIFGAFLVVLALGEQFQLPARSATRAG